MVFIRIALNVKLINPYHYVSNKGTGISQSRFVLSLPKDIRYLFHGASAFIRPVTASLIFVWIKEIDITSSYTGNNCLKDIQTNCTVSNQTKV